MRPDAHSVTAHNPDAREAQADAPNTAAPDAPWLLEFLFFLIWTLEEYSILFLLFFFLLRIFCITLQ
jgi:hypothetical protein